MKFAAASDLHITNKRPTNRKDTNYLETCLNKFDQILTIAKSTSHGMLVVAGDFFESAKMDYEVTYEILNSIIRSGISILVVPGQHDLRYHKTGLKNTPLGILKASSSVVILGNKKPVKIGSISFIGAGWNEVPKAEADVLVTHQMVIQNNKLWNDQTDYIESKDILKKYKWAKCIISGDNHHSFVSMLKGRVNINCGSMMRSTKAQLEHNPICWVIDSENWTKPVGKVLRVGKIEDVFDFDKITREDNTKDSKLAAELKMDEDMEKFINSLPKNDTEKPNFKRVLSALIKSEKVNPNIITIINDVMESIK